MRRFQRWSGALKSQAEDSVSFMYGKVSSERSAFQPLCFQGTSIIQMDLHGSRKRQCSSRWARWPKVRNEIETRGEGKRALVKWRWEERDSTPETKDWQRSALSLQPFIKVHVRTVFCPG